MDHQYVADKARRLYDKECASRYRDKYDESGLESEICKHHGGVLKEITESFGCPIDVFDLGCGTGRYFHYLRDVRRLVGVDISQHMLDEARRPVKQWSIDIGEIELVHSDLFEVDFASDSFSAVRARDKAGTEARTQQIMAKLLHDR